MSVTCRVLEEDSDLAEALPPELLEQAVRECIARVVVLPDGQWDPQQARSLGEGIGLLVLRGTLIRRVGIDGRFGAELLGEGDLLRPWQGEEDTPILPVTTGWRVLAPARMAVLDEAFGRRLGHYPQLSGRLVGRALERSRQLAMTIAIVHQARVDVRLHMLMWHLAGRWGRVHRDGVRLPLRLTHAVLAELVAARRPTVTSALSELSRKALMVPIEDGWLLKGPPPGELMEIAPIPRHLAPVGASVSG